MAASKPNVLIITTHDSGRHFGCYGIPTVHTPAIDAFAADGICFDRMFAASPICSPSRGALLTGRYPLRNGLVGLAGGSWNWELNDYREHLSHRLRGHGYHTAMFGLQHDTAFLDRLGFDDTRAHGIKRDGRPRNASTIASDVASFISGYDKDQPFYAQVGFFETHTSYRFADCEPDDGLGAFIPPYAMAHNWPSWNQILKRFEGAPDAAQQHIAEFQGSLREVDRGIGIVLQALEARGLAENTIVVFNTDHGPELPGAKWTLYDAGIGIAFILRWPGGGVCGGRRDDALHGNVDFLPTLYDWLGMQTTVPFDGVSFAGECGAITGGKPAPARSCIYSSWVDGLNFCVRTSRFKLIRNLVPLDASGRESPKYEMYDLDKDPLELVNVAGMPAYAAEFSRLREQLVNWRRDVGDPSCDKPIAEAEHHAMLAEYRKQYEEQRKENHLT